MTAPFIAPDARVLPYRDLRPQLAGRVFLAPGAMVIGDVALGASSSVWFNAVVRGDIHWIRIGARTNLQDLVVVHVTVGTHPVSIGDRVTVGHAAVLPPRAMSCGRFVGI